MHPPCHACDTGHGRHHGQCPKRPTRGKRTAPPAGHAIPRYGVAMTPMRVTPEERAMILANRQGQK